MNNHVRNITIGLIDGLTIPFALAAGMSSIVDSSRTIFISCVAIVAAWSLTMTAGAYISAKKHEPAGAWPAALTIGISYIAGGCIAAAPFYFIMAPARALVYAAAIVLAALFAAGYIESRVHGANGWAGALRVALTGAAAGLAAYFVAGLFR